MEIEEAKFQPISSISYSNDEIIKNIMSLYSIERFDLDCTYSIGQFWKVLPQPKYKSDLVPQTPDTIQANSTNLPFENNSMKSIMFDPPFVIAGKTYKDNAKGSSIIAKRFCGYENFNELKTHYYGTIKESYRLLQDGGILVLKCQDTVSSGKNHFSHCIAMDMAIKIGFYPKDLFILIAKHRLNSFNGGKWKNQFHARKYHSYFWVFQKQKCRVDYEF
jgi:hypothetical protein